MVSQRTIEKINKALSKLPLHENPYREVNKVEEYMIIPYQLGHGYKRIARELTELSGIKISERAIREYLTRSLDKIKL